MGGEGEEYGVWHGRCVIWEGRSVNIITVPLISLFSETYLYKVCVKVM